MRCYYEVLGVTKDVESTELKKAYYKMSLQWHPDKQHSNGQEDTTKIFQEIQEAYRVLSDPHERAWYDSHRLQILRSGSSQMTTATGTDFDEERIDVFQYFTRSCFDGFNDEKSGFYTVYRTVFENIAREESRYAAADGPKKVTSDDEDAGCDQTDRSYPTFGCSTSSYAKVVSPFYQFWEMFQTQKTYTWVEKYDTRMAESRPERRAMEAENRRLRNAARKKRNDEVRELVSYVKKRDKRVQAERERVEAMNKEAQARSQDIARQARMRDATALSNAWLEEQQLGGIGAQWTEDYDTELRRMEAELDRLNMINGGGGSPVIALDQDAADSADEGLSESDLLLLYCVACDKSFASLKTKQNHEASKKHRKQAELLRQLLLEEETHEADSTGSPVDIDQVPDYCGQSDDSTNPASNGAVTEVKLTKRAKKAQRKRLRDAAKENAVVPPADDTTIGVTGDTEEKASENVTTDSADPKNSVSLPRADTEQPKPSVLVCETCGLECPSRNKLFAHLKETNHAALKACGPVKTKKSKTKVKR